MATYAKIDDLFGNGEVDMEDVELGNGIVVRVRGLTRYELLLNAKNVEDAAEIECRNLVTCMVEPKMTHEQVTKWQQSSPPGVIGKVTDAIRRLSGLGEGQPKSDVQGDGKH